MKESDNQDQALQLIESAHDRLVAVARYNYQKYGRGVMLIAVPQLARGADGRMSMEGMTHALNDLDIAITPSSGWRPFLAARQAPTPIGSSRSSTPTTRPRTRW